MRTRNHFSIPSMLPTHHTLPLISQQRPDREGQQTKEVFHICMDALGHTSILDPRL